MKDRTIEARFAAAAVARLVENPAIGLVTITMDRDQIRLGASTGAGGTSCVRGYDAIAKADDATTAGFLAAGEVLARLGFV